MGTSPEAESGMGALDMAVVYGRVKVVWTSPLVSKPLLQVGRSCVLCRSYQTKVPCSLETGKALPEKYEVDEGAL